MTDSLPDDCDCNGALFVEVWANLKQDEDEAFRSGNKKFAPVGYKCLECDSIQLTREIPERHASDESLDLPDSADRDRVREDE